MITSWINVLLVIFGALTFLPLFVSQFLMLARPNSRTTKDLIIGKNKDWRDRTHYKSALAFAWADVLILLPLFISGSILIFYTNPWAYVIYIILGFLSIYFSILFWVLEKEYTFPAVGAMAYYTYYWGFFLYWGLCAIAFSIFQLWHLPVFT